MCSIQTDDTDEYPSLCLFLLIKTDRPFVTLESCHYRLLADGFATNKPYQEVSRKNGCFLTDNWPTSPMTMLVRRRQGKAKRP